MGQILPKLSPSNLLLKNEMLNYQDDYDNNSFSNAIRPMVDIQSYKIGFINIARTQI